MKYNTATLFAAAAVLVSITSASTSASAECDHFMAGESGEPGICPMRPVTPLQEPEDQDPEDLPPCVEVIIRDNECRFSPVITGPSLSDVSDAYLEAADECNCTGTSFAHWLNCQSCILESGLAEDDVNQIWLRILTGAKSLLCGSDEPDDDFRPAPTTPAPIFSPIRPTDFPNFPPITDAPLDANQAVTQMSCGEEFSKQQDISITTVTDITPTASPTNQSFAATTLATPTIAMVPPGFNTIETTNGASSLGKPALALVIVGSLVLAML
ncbi:uncharacterized protein Triagg1_4507 [Trichoderma aggressivum f. europaeum]|uniref:Uncharacterized protein n=1 Tax=Trichoderma aggressivum f. europaeum TaxID=173218 RepID=A0AAE1J7P5_9HYPO|nr:hypothetical protein Triagg1_4507 [Trichoderma aggressivum f. europaeum]